MNADRLRRATWVPLPEAVAERQLAMLAGALQQRPAPVRLARRAVLIGVALGVLATGGAALAAESAVPGDLLYPVKQVTESVRSVFDDEVVAQHRVEELDELLERRAPAADVEEGLVVAEREVDQLPVDSNVREELDAVIDRIATYEPPDRPVLTPVPTDERPSATTSTQPVRDEPTRTTVADKAPEVTISPDVRPTTTLPSRDVAPTTTKPRRDEPTPTTEPPRDG